jgi:hypothetical protein
MGVILLSVCQGGIKVLAQKLVSKNPSWVTPGNVPAGGKTGFSCLLHGNTWCLECWAQHPFRLNPGFIATATHKERKTFEIGGCMVVGWVTSVHPPVPAICRKYGFELWQQAARHKVGCCTASYQRYRSVCPASLAPSEPMGLGAIEPCGVDLLFDIFVGGALDQFLLTAYGSSSALSLTRDWWQSLLLTE